MLFRPALLRLEDIGPGGSYRTLEGLGKLRTVLEYLSDQKVPFHIALIPRWIQIDSDGNRYEKGIDDSQPDSYTRTFLSLIKSVQQRGALLGMHGYTHQYGEEKRPDDNQDSAIGFEFNVKDAPVTATAAYAAERIQKSLAAFRKTDLYPHFWETPHYWQTPEQEQTFQRFHRILYQSDTAGRAENRPYVTKEGTVFIPTPLFYIHEQNTVEQVLAQLEDRHVFASMFYHSFLEFPFLESVTGPDGKILQRDGLPVYRYRTGQVSNLQRLVHGFRQRGFYWTNLYDVLPTAWIPFTAALRQPWLA
ncbi:DUF2334 domain-containing protein [Effusibacillus dendaii]|uniref:DUF2334 domain-containing protein n=1 Tax=Effusibacillus dendaii TaxID=2743772 RepID=A0A7I8DBB4_9BACL|nr:DUF2334 domain-containing protein [Effusibacillus dendaii]BCJ86642.1 hypothetical protein skT53_16270 [Effusibacillus dendaii]